MPCVAKVGPRRRPRRGRSFRVLSELLEEMDTYGDSKDTANMINILADKRFYVHLGHRFGVDFVDLAFARCLFNQRTSHSVHFHEFFRNTRVFMSI